MYKVWIPVFNRKLSDKEKASLVEWVKKSGADEAMLVFSRILRSEAMLNEEYAVFCENKTAMEDAGIRVGAWLAPSIGYGGTGTPAVGDNDAPTAYTRIRFFDSGEVYAYCPTDDAFCEDFIRTVLKVAESGVKEILFEDDFTLSGGKVVADVACCCDNHLRLYREKIGEEIDRDTLKGYLKTGKKNPYRDAWAALSGDTLRGFAGKIEREVHKLYPDVRLGLSANSSSYFMEGASVTELAGIIAGKNRPFLRLTGAPYWKNAVTLNASIETVRMQAAWCRDRGIEAFTEGDTLPRPRFWSPASRLECYDMILRADGNSDGILKYMLDYTSSAAYETGYIERHIRNGKHYEEIRRRFSGKRAKGITVAEHENIYPEIDYEDIGFSQYGDRNYLPTESQWMLTDLCLPTTYEDASGVTVAFGESAEGLSHEALRRGVILDIRAAKRLMAKGIDVGITGMEKEKSPIIEYFPEDDEYVSCSLDHAGVFYRCRTAPGAEVLSEFLIGNASLGAVKNDYAAYERYPAAIYYENADGEKFLIYPFIPCTVHVLNAWHNGMYRSYGRQKQVYDAVFRMTGKRLPAVLLHSPFVYTICKEDETELAVGVFNVFEDEVPEPVILLGDRYTDVDVYNNTGHLEKDRVVLDREIPPYGFALITLKKI